MNNIARYRSVSATSACVVTMMASSVFAVTFGDYRDDFDATVLPANWQYLWNAPADWTGSSSADATTNPIGDPANYTSLVSNGSAWTVDGDTNNTNGSPGRFLKFTPTGGHPGRGSTQAGTEGNTLDRYAVAAFTMPTAGGVYLTDSFISRGGAGATGDQVLVHINNNAPVIDTIVAPDGNISFDKYLGNLNAGDVIYVAFGPDTNAGSDTFQTDFAFVGGTPTAVADYRDDFNGGAPAAGWQYLWNNSGVIGDPANYTPLLSTGTVYDNDGVPGVPGPDPGRFVNLTASGGHPGLGSTQAGSTGNSIDRYAIAAVTVDATGLYGITDSFLDTLGPQGNGGTLFINVNDGAPILMQTFGSGVNFDFDVLLGDLNAGDTIYLAVGPNGNAGSDSFAWDFTITRFDAVPEPATAMLGVLALAAVASSTRRRRAVG